MPSVIEKYFESHAVQLKEQFGRIRSSHTDSDVKGGRNEYIVGEFLRNHIAAKAIAFNSQILDSHGSHSDEIDISVCNEYQAFVGESPELLIAEGIDFVVQVKAVLTDSELDRTIKNCKSLKKLVRQSSTGDQSRGIKKEDVEWHLNRIPYFVLAFESKLSNHEIIKRLNEKLSQVSLELQPDCLFVLDRLSVINCREGKGIGLTATSDDGEVMTGEGFCGIDSRAATLLRFIQFAHGIPPAMIRMNKPISFYIPTRLSDSTTGIFRRPDGSLQKAQS